ncbi:Methionine synthase [Neomoorella glycerini]|uniref:Methionine synthase n=1 Tax=Neomoorella glycerini TaxID=55779 RepID=A0A6I5ZMU0_9FIRM|nr:corrinoid protein [Moorella glycerini]QGP91156.1 Methionine synthase [Moorella glycerini]
MFEKLVEFIANLQEEEAIMTAKQLLDGGTDPITILELCKEATDLVGKRFERGEYFIPDLLMSGEILRQISELVKSNLEKDVETTYIGKVVIGTVEGDLHDIGKNIVTFLMEANGFQVFDLGIDVPPQKFIDKIKEVKPDIVGMSALLTVAFEAMKATVDAIKEAGLREQVKIIIGGAPTNEEVAKYVGADAYAKDAQQGVRLAKEWI